MKAENQPTSEWEHSHAVDEGDEFETQYGEVYEITAIQNDGSVRVRRLDDADETDEWSEEAVRLSLANGDMERVSDGKSHELATF